MERAYKNVSYFFVVILAILVFGFWKSYRGRARLQPVSGFRQPNLRSSHAYPVAAALVCHAYRATNPDLSEATRPTSASWEIFVSARSLAGLVYGGRYANAISQEHTPNTGSAESRFSVSARIGSDSLCDVVCTRYCLSQKARPAHALHDCLSGCPTGPWCGKNQVWYS